MTTEAIDLDHPGYLRHCAFPLCPDQFHALRGSADGWRMGRAGPIGGAYFCPTHAVTALNHIPTWLGMRDGGSAAGTACACGWTLLPAGQMTLGDYRLAWLLHLRPL